MRIRIVNDGRVLDAAAEQIVQHLQYIAFGKEEATLAEYVDWLAAQVARQEGVNLTVEGGTGREKAAARRQRRSSRRWSRRARGEGAAPGAQPTILAGLIKVVYGCAMDAATHAGEELLTIKVAAKALGVSEQTLRRWDKAGKLHARRHPINHYRLYSLAQVLELRRQILAPTEGTA